MLRIMANKILIFSGAPDSNSLDWHTGGLLSGFQDTIAQFTGLTTETGLHPTTSPAPDHAAWRSLSLDKATIPTGFSQQYDRGVYYGPEESAFGSSPEFLATVSLSFDSDADDGEQNSILSQFYEHSVVIHEELSSSQLISQSTGQSTSLLSDSTSFLSGNGSQPGSTKGPVLFRGSDLIGDLRSIPSAAYLLKIHPQTMTYNLIVGIISISQPRAVKTRWGATKYLVEVLVGDETKAGFAITYWLPYDSVEDSPLGGMRPRDVVLIQNVAFNVFMKKVYGSSLRKDLTRVHLLYRVKLDPQDTGGYYTTSDLSSAGGAHPQLAKTRRVRDWVLNFVGRGSHNRAKPDPRPRWDKPPDDDTQLA
ncbi:hypothetical protein CHGG_09099 [Chaetomium globosum CBS 148.51]|uniref:Uncharacterized protein n=1 Tax=Chaetomium globosum (strain ATCC 6205 / CBS 148.51 / DSM 1962 / NBRC 6347 / NRRL 1970) TaxID=306901 RepID=Q2GSF5_CHAGB|nr:uncharacterized protein CHGG_09099 [Chaetomium globosum CBS 148.51]EAQ85085.1 hypothetical protein CHGG_09099 [Chaetomium globosum CBS 148.51]